MDQCIELEQAGPTTINEHYLADYKDKYHTRFRAQYKLHSASARSNSTLRTFIDGTDSHINTEASQAILHLSNIGFTKLNKDSLLKLLPANINDAALEIMAEVRHITKVSDGAVSAPPWKWLTLIAVAYKRFVDNVPMAIDFVILNGFKRTIRDVMFAELRLGEVQAKELCAEYLTEDPDVKSKRDTLSSKSKRLEKARIALQKVRLPGLAGSRVFTC